MSLLKLLLACNNKESNKHTWVVKFTRQLLGEPLDLLECLRVANTRFVQEDIHVMKKHSCSSNTLAPSITLAGRSTGASCCLSVVPLLPKKGDRTAL